MSGNNPYAVNGYSGSNPSVSNPYAQPSQSNTSLSGRYVDPYLQPTNESSTSVNSYGSRERVRGRANIYEQRDRESPRPGSGGGGGGGYGGLGRPRYGGEPAPPLPHQAPAPPPAIQAGYDPFRDRRQQRTPPEPERQQRTPQDYDRQPRPPQDYQRSQPQWPPQDRSQRPSTQEGEKERRPSDGRGQSESRSRERRDLRPPNAPSPIPPLPTPKEGGVRNGYTSSFDNRYVSPRRPAKNMDEILKHIQSNWKTMEGDECIPVKLALQLMDPSSLGLADKEGDFANTHVDLQKCLKGLVNEHYADFNSAVGTYHKIQNAIKESQARVRTLKAGLLGVKDGMLNIRPELRGLAESSGELDDMIVVLGVIEELKNVPGRLEERISEKKFLGAVDLLLESLRGSRKSELDDIGAMTDLRGYFASQEASLVDILIEELHDHLYLKSPYCQDRWKGTNPDGGEKGAKETLTSSGNNIWERPVYHYLSSMDTTTVMVEDASKNPEADTFYYIHMLLESLNKLGQLEEAVSRIEQRMPVELYKVVEKTNNEIDAKYPVHLRGQVKKDKTSRFSMKVSPIQNQVLSDFLWTLYAKFEAIAEGHRVLHEIVLGFIKRDRLPKPDKYTTGFKELWKLYQMEIRSLLHDYLATDSGTTLRIGMNANTNSDVFGRNYREKHKRMFKLTEVDEKSKDIKADEEDLDEILKNSVPGLVKSRAKASNNQSERAIEGSTSAGHQLLIEPSVFNMTILLAPSLAFLIRLKDVVPQTSSIPMSTLTSFLDDFLINIFHPQLEEAVTELCTRCMVDLEAFAEDSQWSKHSPHPIFKGTTAFMALIRAFSTMLSAIPQDQLFTQLIINQLVTYYDRCYGFYKAIATRSIQAPNSNVNTLVMKAPAAFADSGDVHEVSSDLLREGMNGSQRKELVEKEVQLLLSATKASPLAAYDIISDPKTVHQLSLLYNSMQWLSSALVQLRHVEATSSTKSHSHTPSQSQNHRRWTLMTSLKRNSSAGTYLPLSQETVSLFDTTLTSFRNLSHIALLTLHIDIRCGVIYQLSQCLKSPAFPTSPNPNRDSSGLPSLDSGLYPFVLTSPPSSASPLILQLNNDLITFDANIASYLGIKERSFIVSGLGKLVDQYLVIRADDVGVMNTNGAERMRVDAMVVQQNLRGLVSALTTAAHAAATMKTTNLPSSSAESSEPTGLGITTTADTTTSDALDPDEDGMLLRSARYYELFLLGPDEIMNIVKTARTNGSDVGYSYDELRTLVELCFSASLRGDDREEAVKARKRMGDVLLELGEAMWDS